MWHPCCNGILLQAEMNLSFGKAENFLAKRGQKFVGFGMDKRLQPPRSFEAISATVNFGKAAASIHCATND
jgi:hypothetical protein